MDSFKIETHGAAALPMTKKQKSAPWDEDDDYLYELAALPMTKKPAPCDEENYLSLLQTHSLPPEDSDVVDKLLFRLESLSVVEEMVHLFLENAIIAVEHQSALVNKVAAEKKALLNAREAINVNLYQELMMSSQTSCALSGST